MTSPDVASTTVGLPARRSSNGPVRRAPAARIHEALGAKITLESAWELPASYGDVEGERALLREGIAVADITARGKVDVRGRIDDLLRTAPGLGLVARVADDWALVLSGPGGEAQIRSRLERAAGPSAMVTDATHLYAGYALAGPGLPDALARLTGWDPATLAPGDSAGAPIAEVRAVVVRRDLELPVLEVYVATELARYAWEELLAIARSLGGGPAGWDALRAEGWS